MSFKKIFVNCDDSKQAEEVISTALVMGYKRLGRSEQLKDVIMDCNGVVFDSFCEPHKKDYFEVLEYQKFMEKYSNKENVMNKQLMISRINAAKEKLNLGDSELSVKLGHNRNYISRVLHQENPSLEQMTKVVKKCNDLILSNYDIQIDSGYKCASGGLSHGQSVHVEDAKMISLKELNELHETIASQKKELDHKNQVLDKRNALLENNAVAFNDIESQLKETQEKFIDVVDQKDKEIGDIKSQLSKKQDDFWTLTRENATLINKSKDDRVVALIIVVILTAILVFKSL